MTEFGESHPSQNERNKKLFELVNTLELLADIQPNAVRLKYDLESMETHETFGHMTKQEFVESFTTPTDSGDERARALDQAEKTIHQIESTVAGTVSLYKILAGSTLDTSNNVPPGEPHSATYTYILSYQRTISTLPLKIHIIELRDESGVVIYSRYQIKVMDTDIEDDTSIMLLHRNIVEAKRMQTLRDDNVLAKTREHLGERAHSRLVKLAVDCHHGLVSITDLDDELIKVWSEATRIRFTHETVTLRQLTKLKLENLIKDNPATVANYNLTIADIIELLQYI